MPPRVFCSYFFFRAEDGIRDGRVTGVQTCALPIFFGGAAVKRTARHDPRGAHHIEHACGKAEQNKGDEPPGRNAEPAVDEPANAATDQHACNEFAREPEASGVAGCSRRPILTGTIGRPARLIAGKPFAEPLKSRGERGLIGMRVAAVAILARVVAHALDTRGSAALRHARPLEAARTILTGIW